MTRPALSPAYAKAHIYHEALPDIHGAALIAETLNPVTGEHIAYYERGHKLHVGVTLCGYCEKPVSNYCADCDLHYEVQA